MKKRLVCLLAIGAMLLSGCGMAGNITVNEDGTYTTTSRMYYTEEELATLNSEEYSGGADTGLTADKAVEVIEKNGVKYYGFDDDENASSAADTLEESDYGLTPGGFFMDTTLASDEDLEMAASMYDMFDFMDVSITFPEELTVANVNLSDDKKTVLLTKEDYKKFTKLYAFSEKTLDNDKKGPFALNANDQKKIKNNKKYKKGLVLQFADNATGIKTSKLDGKKVTNGVTVKKKGTHKLVLEDYAGNTSTIKFTIK
ncbi:MAG: hypothetical protein IKQ56_04565 [Lachnospiraceae bacterium]|nr:hypothetical protein [Lachnospiraceae bacterium]